MAAGVRVTAPSAREEAAAPPSWNWHEVAIGEIADVVGGGTPSTKDAGNFGGSVPWLTPRDLSGTHDRRSGRGERYLSRQGLDSSSAKQLPKGAALLSTRAPIGYVALAKNPIATNQGFRSLLVRGGTDRMVDSEMGEIPEGWRRRTLTDLARLNPESWSSNNVPDRIRYVDLANTKWGSINDIQEFTWEDAPSRGRRVLRRGDTIVGTVRPRNGSFALIDRDGLTGNTAFAVLRPTTPTERELVWCAATSRDAIERLAHLADGGAYPAVKPRAVLDTAVALPTGRLRLVFSSLAAPLVNRMGATQRESRTLAALRDTLLPKLISGEIRVLVASREPAR